MDINRLRGKAKDMLDKRGGTEGLKADADRLKGIAKGPGSLGDKAKRAADAVKAPRTDTTGGGTGTTGGDAASGAAGGPTGDGPDRPAAS